ncbi:hypothetical protein HG535_0E02700 [Zygotorulaspora mrakii]|uniref:Nuclear speckle splicing regulatory protein 1 N-terminal domain-containing protein n=1 Tax=Zygotorulaspora mrakii TaxID=42260 RepID=A0A7H9B488_ZYGMR|nr:uncharacterized protein HG535_0E02700 [Zygotorulaspora mrakii]QLG73186.1 hypothetical protein HG535_0E02700 [Zygotorulaspora mrakii]
MVKAKRRPVFADYGSESDDDNDGKGFKRYIEKKSAKLQKQRAGNKEPEFDIENLDPEERQGFVRQEAKSIYINDLLKSKEQRNLDKLHIESEKNRLQNEINKPLNGNTDTFITQCYQDRKKEYELAAEVAESELKDQKNSINNNGLLGNAAQGVALRLLLADEKGTNRENSAKSSNVDPLRDSHSRERSVKYGNDVFTADGYTTKSRNGSETSRTVDVLNWGPIVGEELISVFLQPTKTSQELQAHLEQYKMRHSDKSS